MLCPGFADQPSVPVLLDGAPADNAAASSEDRPVSGPVSAASAGRGNEVSEVSPGELLSDRLSMDGA